jgi:hypothetical protein
MNKAELAITVLSIMIGFLLMAKVATKPRSFWPMLLSVTIITGGIVLKGISYIDECLVACILVGVYVASPIRRVKLNDNSSKEGGRFSKLHTYFFWGMIIYMIIESGRGIIVSGSARQIRWIVYYLLIGLISNAIQKQKYHFPTVRKAAIIITLAGLVYFSLYLGVGMLITPIVDIQDKTRGIQNVYWGGTAYATFPLVIVLPTILVLFKDEKAKIRRLAWLTLLVSVFNSFYYGSRISWVCLTVFFIISFKIIGLRRWLGYGLIYFLILIFSLIFIFSDYYKLSTFADILYKPFVFFVSSPETADSESQDYGRTAEIKVAFKAISSQPGTFLWGYGLRTAGIVIGPYLAEMLFRYGKYRQAFSYYDTTNISTNGFTAIVVETGLIGLSLLLINFYFVARNIIVAKGSPLRSVLLASLVLTFFWFTITNPFDIVLFYLLLMPAGLLIQLSKPIDKNALREEKYWEGQEALLSEIASDRSMSVRSARGQQGFYEIK